MRTEHAPSALLLNEMSELLPYYQWLASDDGQQQLERATELRSSGIADLKIGEQLRATLDVERAALVLTQLDLRERARAKFSNPEKMLFTRPGLEQATSEAIATYRAERLTGSVRIVELCCGIGGDLIALAGLGVPLVAVDLDPVHLFLAEHNARMVHPNVDITPLLQDVRETRIESTDTVFIDPARRLESGKRIGYQSEPPVDWSIALAERAAGVAIKTAPGIPHELVPTGWELEHISLGSDLKEAVMWSPSLAENPYRATVIDGESRHMLIDQPGEPVAIRDAQPGDWLHDINPAVTNAGLVESLARQINADRIDAEIGFLVSDKEIDSPFTTSWRVLDVLPWHEKRIKQALKLLDAGPIDIRRRGLPGDVPSITKRLRDKGNRHILIAMTRMNDVPTAILCEFRRV